MLLGLMLGFLFVCQTSSLSVLTDDNPKSEDTKGDLTRQLLNQETVIRMNLDRKVYDLMRDIADMKTKMADMDSNNKHLQEEIKEAKNEVLVLKHENAALKAELQLQSNETTLISADIRTTSSNLANIKTKMADMKTNTDSKHRQLQEEITDAKKEVLAVKHENSALKAELQLQSNETTLISDNLKTTIDTIKQFQKAQQELSSAVSSLEVFQKNMSSLNSSRSVFPTPHDCQDYLWEGYQQSGLYTIYPQRGGRLEVYCDQQTDGGGWTVIQRRADGSEDFFRNWTDYKYGFGNKSNEFWLGNHRIYEIVSRGFYELRIDMTDFAGESRYAVYRRFSIGAESQGFKLLIEDYQGTAGDSLKRQNGAQFYTKDPDTDSCAARFKGGWWYEKCHDSNLNGLYLRGAHSSFADGIEWKAWHGYNYSLKFTEMKIRRL